MRLGKIRILRYALLTSGSALGILALVGWAGNIDAVKKWAWGTTVGWINFAPVVGSDNSLGAALYSDHLEGYIWGESIGWVRLGTHTGGGNYTYSNTSAADYGVNRNNATGPLSGFAWGTSVGWIKFDPANGGVTIAPSGSFDGYAWGESIGWIHFKGDGYNVLLGSKVYLPVVRR